MTTSQAEDEAYRLPKMLTVDTFRVTSYIFLAVYRKFFKNCFYLTPVFKIYVLKSTNAIFLGGLVTVVTRFCWNQTFEMISETYVSITKL